MDERLRPHTPYRLMALAVLALGTLGVSAPAPRPSHLLSLETQRPFSSARLAAAKATAEAARKGFELKREEAALDLRINASFAAAERWQLVYEPLPARAGPRPERASSLAQKRALLGLWQRRARLAMSVATHPPHFGEWLCIHRYEGAWDDATGNGYYGGLQMDLSFMAHYGWWHLKSEGTADHWTPLEQIWTAERARRSGRGFYPWPNTARICGLL